jgi:LPS-assembly lipoprotein
MAARRAFVLSSVGALLALGGPLAGCGWEPLYADSATLPASAELRAVKVAPIPERIGQRLELALRQSLNPDGVATPQRYLLRTTLRVSRVDLGIQTQGLGTRLRVDVSAYYELRDLKTGARLLAETAHVTQSFDIVANDYSNVVAEDDARRRAVKELSREMTIRLALFMQRRTTPKPLPAKP